LRERVRDERDHSGRALTDEARSAAAVNMGSRATGGAVDRLGLPPSLCRTRSA